MAAIERRFTLSVPSSTENLAMIREFVTAVGIQAGFTDEEVTKLELAVDEACTNVIEHAYGHDVTKEVIVRARFDGETIEIDVVDTGRGFDPAALPVADVNRLIAERRSGGLGFQVIRQVMDEVSYEMTPGQVNQLRMVKRIRKARDPETEGR
jgi:serine/threonine-protein kinase RsbW